MTGRLAYWKQYYGWLAFSWLVIREICPCEIGRRFDNRHVRRLGDIGCRALVGWINS